MTYLADTYGGFTSPWRSTVDRRNGEDAYTELVAEHLDVERTVVVEAGCGHGAEALRLATRAKQVIAFDAVAAFVAIAERERARQRIENVRFLVADCSPKRNDGVARLPVEDHSVDLVIGRRGPTSWIADAARAVRTGGALLHLAYQPTPAPPWNDELPVELRVVPEPEVMPGAVLERLAAANLPLHSSWTFDVAEVFDDPRQLYERLRWDRRDPGAPAFDGAVRSVIERVVANQGGTVELRQRRFLWKAVVT